jgi:hypothetical protein
MIDDSYDHESEYARWKRERNKIVNLVPTTAAEDKKKVEMKYTKDQGSDKLFSQSIPIRRKRRRSDIDEDDMNLLTQYLGHRPDSVETVATAEMQYEGGTFH